MSRSERQDSGTRGGTGTMTRQARRAQRDQVPDGPLPPAPGSRAAEAGERPGRQGRRVPAPRPVTGQQPQAQAQASGQRTEADQRAGRPRGQRVQVQAPARRGPGTAPRPESSPAQRPPASTASRPPASTAPRPPASPAPRPPASRAGRPENGAPPAVVTPARPARRSPAAPPWRVPPASRPVRPRPGADQDRLPPAPAQSVPQAEPAAPAVTALRSGTHRMPFFLLLCGLLGGALISALVISTTLAEGSFQITRLQDATSVLTNQRQALEVEVAQQQSAQVISREATALGMRRVQELQFLDLVTGKTSNDGPVWSGAVGAPGYNP